MIVDTSALVAIWFNEPDAEQLSAAILDDPQPKISAATVVELFAVLDNRADPADRRRLDTLLTTYRLRVEPFTAAQAALARDAYRDFGRGSGHPARLNLGDCYSYALAADTGEPILFVGDDFTHTDLPPAR
jgi:ribonuclease VapC